MKHQESNPLQNDKTARKILEKSERSWKDRPLPVLKVSAPLPVGSARLYQMKVTLLGIDPPIWRRFVVPSFLKLEHLHNILQCVMGWEDEHAYEFEIDGAPFLTKGDYLILNDELKEEVGYDAAQYELSQLIRPGMVFSYIYDFGDLWRHEILVEHDHYSRNVEHAMFCLEGERACPPEDCGGPNGYKELLEILADPEHPEYEDRLEWVGDRFDSERYDPKKANRRLGTRAPKENDAPRTDRDAARKKKKQERQRKKDARKHKKK